LGLFNHRDALLISLLLASLRDLRNVIYILPLGIILNALGQDGCVFRVYQMFYSREHFDHLISTKFQEDKVSDKRAAYAHGKHQIFVLRNQVGL
jgi:hypothetical protein